MLKIKTGVVSKPEKLLIYGAEGIGKTTLASKVPDPLFIDTEGSTLMFDVKRVDPSPKDWNTLLAIINEIIADPGICKSLVIDTADWAEQMCIEEVCRKNHKDGIESFNYGRGYTYVMEEFSNLIKALDRVIAVGINVIITAHAKMRKMELPDEQGAFDRWELKLSRQVAPLVKEWVDDILFINYKTTVIKTDTATKAYGGKRVIYTAHSPVWDAKNRHGLAEELPLAYDSIAPIFSDHPAAQPQQTAPTPSAPKAPAVQVGIPVAEASVAEQLRHPDLLNKLSELAKQNVISEAEIEWAVSTRGYFPQEVSLKDYPSDFIEKVLIAAWPAVERMILEHRNEVDPF